MVETKKEAIQKLAKTQPHLTNDLIATHTNSSTFYVDRLLGKNRKPLIMETSSNGGSPFGSNEKKNLWAKFKQTQKDFIKEYLPTHKYKTEQDFSSNYYLPTEDQWGATGSGQDFSGSWSQYEWLAERRIGPGAKITRFPAEDAIREGFQIIDSASRKIVEREDIEQFLKDTDLLNELARVIYFERVYGIGFLLAYYSEDDKKNNVLAKELQSNEKTPVAFEALPPTHLAPINMFESKKLDKNPQNWDLRGGLIDPQRVNHERIRVFMSRPVVNRWYGLSIIEMVWDHIMPYYQSQIYLLRGFAKWGNMIVDYEVPEDDDLDAIFDKNAEIIEEMKMNGSLLHPRGTTVNMLNTQLGTGLDTLIEIWLEGMASGTGIPVPILMGRVTSAGLSGAAYLMAERYYWNMIKNIQVAFTDDVRAILEGAGFDLEGQEINWKLAVTKTDQQRLIDEGMEIENEMMKVNLEILKEQFVQTQIQTLFMLDQAQNPEVDENPQDNKDRSASGNDSEMPKGTEEKPSEKRKEGIQSKLAKEREDFFYGMAKQDIITEIRNKRIAHIKAYHKQLSEVLE